MENINKNEGKVLTNKVGKVAIKKVAEFKKLFCDIITYDFYNVLSILKDDLDLNNRWRSGYTWNTADRYDCCGDCCAHSGEVFTIKNGMKKYGIDYKKATKWIYDTIQRECAKIANKQTNDFFDLKFDI